MSSEDVGSCGGGGGGAWVSSAGAGVDSGLEEISERRLLITVDWRFAYYERQGK